MLELPLQETALDTRLVQGRVSEFEGRRYIIDTSHGSRLCLKAAGCLLDPAEGDLVLAALAGEELENSYILTVLERADGGSPVRLSLHEGAAIEASEGRLSLLAEREATVHSTGHVGITGDTLELAAREGRLLIRFLSVIGHACDSLWQEYKQTATTMKTTCLRSIQTFGDSLRRVKNTDETHASHVRMLASESLYAQGKFVNHTASEVVKIDGREVHLG